MGKEATGEDGGLVVVTEGMEAKAVTVVEVAGAGKAAEREAVQETVGAVGLRAVMAEREEVGYRSRGGTRQ